MNRTRLIDDMAALQIRLNARRFELPYRQRRVVYNIQRSHPFWKITAGLTAGFLAGLLFRSRPLPLLLGLIRHGPYLISLTGMIHNASVTGE